LAAELRTWDDADARKWAANFAPLERRLVELVKGYLPRLTYPIRTGVHPDTAFSLALILDYCRAVKGEDARALESQIVAFAREKYLGDRNYPAAFEPSGEDFFSPALNECDLMRRVLSREELAKWLDGFLPELSKVLVSLREMSPVAERQDYTLTPHAEREEYALLTPAVVSDIADPKLGHLAGLNLSRAWTQRGILNALPQDDPRRAALERSIEAHAISGLSFVFSGHYEGEHWLATFAVYLLTDAEIAR
jgi:hypothetical protein